MLHAKSRDHRTLGSGEEYFKGFAIYGHDGYLGHVTKTIFTKCMFPVPKEAPHKNWL